MKTQSKDVVVKTDEDSDSNTEEIDVEDEMDIIEEKYFKNRKATENDDSMEDKADAEDKVDDNDRDMVDVENKKTEADMADEQEARPKKTAVRRLAEGGDKKQPPISGLNKTLTIIPPVVKKMISLYKNNPDKISNIVDFVDENINKSMPAGIVINTVNQYFEKLEKDALEERSKEFVEGDQELSKENGKDQLKDDYARFIMGLLCANKKNGPFVAKDWKDGLLNNTYSTIVQLSRVTFSPRHLFLLIICEPNAADNKNFVIPEILRGLFQLALDSAVVHNQNVASLKVDPENATRDNLCKLVNSIFCEDDICNQDGCNEVKWVQIPTCLKEYDPLKTVKRAERKRQKEIKELLKEEKQRKKYEKQQETAECSKPKKSRTAKLKKSKQASEEENAKKVNIEATILEQVEEDNGTDKANETDEVKETKETDEVKETNEAHKVEEPEDHNNVSLDQKAKSKKNPKTPKVPKEPKTPKVKTQKDSKDLKRTQDSQRTKETKQPKEPKQHNISNLEEYDSDDESTPFEDVKTQKPHSRKQTTPKKFTETSKARKARAAPVDLDDKEEMIQLC